jgi:N-acetylmuramoyl-L-alanine amidase
LAPKALPFLFFFLLFPGYGAEEKRLSIYSTIANYSLPVTERDGREYVGMLEVLDPLGSVRAQTQGSTWSMRYNSNSAEFTNDKPQAQIRGQRVEMPTKFILENGRGLVPVSALSMVLPRILGGPVSVHESARRVFIGAVSVHFTAQMGKSEPPTLVMNFSAPVNPTISTEPGKLVMAFTRDPLVPPGTQSLTFDSSAIPSARFDEANGAALVTVNASGSLFASFSNGGRTITITGPRQNPTASPAPSPAQNSGSTNATNPSQATGNQPPPSPTAPPQAPTVRYFAVIDASHGGEERGAALSDKLPEKDVSLAFARALRQELQAHGLTTLLLRDGDTTLTLDQRAQIVNHTQPGIYIAIHASSQGNGVRLFSSLIPGEGQNRGMFADWNTAQAFFLPVSRAVATSLGGEIEKKRISTRVLVAPLRPLNNITRPAIAIELAPPTTGMANLNSASYHQLVSSSIASALLSMRNQLEAGR